MPLTLTFEFYGDEQVTRTLEAISDRITNSREAFDTMGDRLEAAEIRQFDSEGGYGSGGWPALSPAYAAWKAKHYPGAPILVRTGALREDLTQRPFSIDVVEDRMALFGSAVPYGRFHQGGTDQMPRRRPIELPNSEREEWAKVMQRWIMGAGR